MKFDYIIGNPPYQETVTTTKIKGVTPTVNNVFQKFQLEADKLCKKTSCLIYPGGRWIQQSGKGLASFGHNQMNDVHLAKLYYCPWPTCTKIFNNTVIKDGVSIVIKDFQKTYSQIKYVYDDLNNSTTIMLDHPGDNIIPLNPVDFSIIDKVNIFITNNNLKYLKDAIKGSRGGKSVFGISSNFVENNPDKVKEYHDGMEIKSNEIKLLTNHIAGSMGRATWYIVNRDDIPENKEYIDLYKVINSNNADHFEILPPGTAHGRSRISFYILNTNIEAENCKKYLMSNIIRFLLNILGGSQTNYGKTVPDMLDYTNSNKLIDWSNNIDEQMYKLLNLTQDEIKRIESIMKANSTEK